MEYTKILSLDQLREKAKDGVEGFIQLNGCRSSKYVKYDKKTDKFRVENMVDSSTQNLTSVQLMSKEYSNIGEAIRKGAFYIEE